MARSGCEGWPISTAERLGRQPRGLKEVSVLPVDVDRIAALEPDPVEAPVTVEPRHGPPVGMSLDRRPHRPPAQPGSRGGCRRARRLGVTAERAN